MLKLTVSAFAASLLTLGLNTAAQALPPSRVFVSATGNDSSPNCSFGAPCRTFQHAHDVVAADGEIDVLDPAGYGALTINKAISIQGHGFSGITATSGNAITVSPGGFNKVNLRGLLLDGSGTGANGITFDTSGVLNVQDCAIRNFTTN